MTLLDVTVLGLIATALTVAAGFSFAPQLHLAAPGGAGLRMADLEDKAGAPRAKLGGNANAEAPEPAVAAFPRAF